MISDCPWQLPVVAAPQSFVGGARPTDAGAPRCDGGDHRVVAVSRPHPAVLMPSYGLSIAYESP